MTHILSGAAKMARRINSLGLFLGFALGLPLFGFLYIAVVPSRPTTPAVLTELDGVVSRGGAINLKFKSDRKFDCEVTVARWMYRVVGRDDRGRDIKDYVPLKGNPTNPPVGTGEGLEWYLTLDAPDKLAPGRWFYTYDAWYGCRWGLPIAAVIFGRPHRRGEPVPILVVDPPADTPPAIVSAPGPITVVPTK